MKNCSLSFTRRDWECFKRRLTRWAAYRGIPLNRNDFILRRYRNHFRGRPAFIVGNGPSLRISDLDMLRGHLTLASNKIYLSFEETLWRPHFLFMEDAKVIAQSRPSLEDLGLVQLMLPDSVRLPQLDALYYHYHWMKLPPPPVNVFILCVISMLTEHMLVVVPQIDPHLMSKINPRKRCNNLNAGWSTFRNAPRAMVDRTAPRV